MNVISVYVGVMRALRAVLRSIGLLGLLEKSQSRPLVWIRSLFAIYDLDDMIKLSLPWWTFEAATEVDRILSENPGARVFEWGSGASTLWLAARAKEIISIEHDSAWATKVQARLDSSSFGAKVSLVHIPSEASGEITSQKRGFARQFFDNYVAAIDAFDGQFDFIVIDGRAREACLSKAVSRLSPGGRILLDDFKRERYQQAVRQLGLSVEIKDGLAVSLPLPDSTALLGHPT